MKILILYASDPYKAAGILAYDIMQGLSDSGSNDVKLLVSTRVNGKDNRIISVENLLEAYYNAFIRRFKRYTNKIFKTCLKGYKTKEEKQRSAINNDYCFENNMSKTYYSTRKILNRVGFNPDVVLVLSMPGFVSYQNLFEIQNITAAKLFLYFFDMAPLTGGCHYAWDCMGYTKECGSCPALYSNNPNDQTRFNFNYKKEIIEKTDIIPIVATEWQLRQLNKSSLFKNNRKFKVMLPINENIFISADKQKIRCDLGLPNDKKIIFFGAVTIHEKRKGVKYLIEALNILYNNIDNPSEIHIIIAGNKSADFKNIFPFSYSFLGYFNHQNLPKAFQAADVFVCPSIEDSGPMMINQSVMCGTPVVSFEMGVALDLVISGETGYRAKLEDAEDLALGIKSVLELNENELLKMQKNCIELGHKLSSSKTQVEKFIECFNTNS